ncbi:phosphoglycolate phosphatase [Pseudoluteimonas lycopersici]|uniref:phosphoglycolate phosphatase n=1 Tax=Pseudoluteimonas lycopersici TaxID=1324796 RepID=A0A516V3Q8_9GAMM|nr:phosphoglycolate phosphatase [Lysobacter lycopersici]QDQ73166.1 phosphoglycolate phosphatase [Lysobacter lycopersici]
MNGRDQGAGVGEQERREPDPSGSRHFPKLALFDLDGTLLDSAPDMVATINRMRERRGQGPMPLAELRPHVSRGSRAMSAAAFPELGGDVPQDMIREFLDTYEQELGRHSVLFDGVAQLLDAIEVDGARWGIVTNKPEYLARLVLPQLGWESRCAILIGGDTLPERKPHPLPLLHAARTLGADIADCVYVGDDQRDIEAARAAGMKSVVALWGYRLPDEQPAGWGGDMLVEVAADLLDPLRWP